MNLRINNFSTQQYYRNFNNKSSQTNSVNFNGSKTKFIRNTGFALVSMFALASCGGNNTNGTNSTNEINDTIQITTPKQPDKVETTKKYHFFPKEEKSVSSDSYDWVEEIFPDGRVEKDSMNYKISITPNGERTVAHKSYDESGNMITTTTFPDSTKIVHTIYKTQNPQEVLTMERAYWSNGNLRESKFYHESPSDSISDKTVEYSVERYNENEVLLYWDSNVKDPDRNEIYNKYDSMNRLIYDNVKNEEYKYKDKSTVPYCSTSEFEGCVRTTLYNDDGTTKEVFFKASDGTITNAEDIK